MSDNKDKIKKITSEIIGLGRGWGDFRQEKLFFKVLTVVKSCMFLYQEKNKKKPEAELKNILFPV